MEYLDRYYNVYVTLLKCVIINCHYVFRTSYLQFNVRNMQLQFHNVLSLQHVQVLNFIIFDNLRVSVSCSQLELTEDRLSSDMASVNWSEF